LDLRVDMQEDSGDTKRPRNTGADGDHSKFGITLR
jgi:hypothetical protein